MLSKIAMFVVPMAAVCFSNAHAQQCANGQCFSQRVVRMPATVVRSVVNAVDRDSPRCDSGSCEVGLPAPRRIVSVVPFVVSSEPRVAVARVRPVTAFRAARFQLSPASGTVVVGSRRGLFPALRSRAAARLQRFRGGFCR